MNRIEFTKSIEFEDFEKNVIRYFDEIMALYGLMKNHSNYSIESKVDTDIIFLIEFTSDQDTSKAYMALKDKTIEIYGHLYNIDVTIQGKYKIKIKLKDIPRA